MNNLYFACPACKVFLDAGYRWAYWGLEEPEIVKLGQSVNVDLVLAAPEYWGPEPGEQSKWLIDEVLPSVRLFLETHRAHGIFFDERGGIFDADPGWYLEWIQEGYGAELLPRFFEERLQLRSWTEVCQYINRLKFKPSWWGEPEERTVAERWYKARLIRRCAEPHTASPGG